MEPHERTAIREVSNAHDVYAVAVMHDPGQVLAEDGTQSAMTACSAVCSLSTLLIRCTVCEVAGASPQTSHSVSRYYVVPMYVGSCNLKGELASRAR